MANQDNDLQLGGKYTQIGDKYYTQQDVGNARWSNIVPGKSGGYSTQLTEISPQEIRSRVGDVIGSGDLGKTMFKTSDLSDQQLFGHMKNGGDIKELDPANTNRYFNALRNANVHVPGTIPQNTETVAGNPLQPAGRINGVPTAYGASQGYTDTSSRYEQGFNNAMGSGVGGTTGAGYTKDANGDVRDALGNKVEYKDLPKGVDGKPLMNLENLPKSGSDIVNQNVRTDQTDQNANAQNYVNTDPNVQKVIADYNAISNIQNQRQSLNDIYSQMTNKLGIPAIDTQMLNIKKVMTGTEQDIRDEVTKAGGFATNSAVLALTNARNKQNVKDYHDLVNLKAQLQKTLSTQMTLTEKDRAETDKMMTQRLGIDEKLVGYGHQMQRDAFTHLEFMQKTVGWKGILDATGGDPNHIAQIEQIAGMSPGGLAKAVQDEHVKPTGEKVTTIEHIGGKTYKVTKQGDQEISRTEQAPKKSPADDQQKTIKSFNKDLGNKSPLFGANAVTREQFGRQLQAKYPNIKPDAIMREIYKTYPDDYNKGGKSSGKVAI